MTGTTTGSRTPAVGTSTGATTGSGSVADTAKDAVGTAAEKAKGAGSELTHMAQERAGDAAHKLADRADERRTDLADAARTIEEKFREFASSVAEEQPKVGEALERVTDSAGRLVDWVERTPAEEMAQDLSDQLRRRPLLFAAGMFGAGFALSRVLKPVDRSMDGGRQLGSGGSTRQLPMASAVDGGMH